MLNPDYLRGECNRLLHATPEIPNQVRVEISLRCVDVLALLDRLQEVEARIEQLTSNRVAATIPSLSPAQSSVDKTE